MSEPDFNIETVDPGDIGYNHLNLQAELTELDDIYDGALLFFEWGESDSLEEGETELATVIMKDEDGNFKGSVTGEQFTADEGKWVDLDYYNIKMPVEVTDTDDDELYNEGPEDDYEFDYVNGRIKVLEDGDMEDGTDYEVDYDYGYGNVIIDELSENTEYHYKAIVESIAYASEASMENIFENERSMDAIITAFDKVTDSEVAMDEVTDSESAMDAVTDSEIAMDKVVTKEMSCLKYKESNILKIDVGVSNGNEYNYNGIVSLEHDSFASGYDFERQDISTNDAGMVLIRNFHKGESFSVFFESYGTDNDSYVFIKGQNTDSIPTIESEDEAEEDSLFYERLSINRIVTITAPDTDYILIGKVARDATGAGRDCGIRILPLYSKNEE